MRQFRAFSSESLCQLVRVCIRRNATADSWVKACFVAPFVVPVISVTQESPLCSLLGKLSA